jgi:sentrin-specific protease 1
MSLIAARSAETSGSFRWNSCFAFSTFFYETLRVHKLEAVAKFGKNVNIFSFDILLFPICVKCHWTLCVYYTRNKVLRYYDGKGGNGKVHLSKIQKYLEAKYFELQGKKLVGITCQVGCNVPKQNNSSDCGVFLCLFAERISRGADFDFSEADCPYFRLRIASEIQLGRLVVDRCSSCSNIIVPFDETSPSDGRIGFPCLSCQSWTHYICADEPDQNVCGFCKIGSLMK